MAHYSQIFYKGIKMSENFIKLKKRSFKIRLLGASIVAFSVGCLVFGVLSLLTNFEKLSLWWVYSLSIALGAAAFSWLLVFALGKASDLKIAKRFDKQFALREKTQTMLEYGKAKGAIYALQRADTEETLKAIPVKRVRLSHSWAYAVCAVLSAGVLAASFVLEPKPVISEVKPTEEIPFAMTQMQRVSLEKLIEEVSESKMESPYKENITLTITELLDELLLAETESARDTLLNGAMDEILATTDKSSSAVELIDALYIGGQENIVSLVGAINYYAWKVGEEWESYYEGAIDFLASFAFVEKEDEETDETEKTQATALLLKSASSNLSMGLLRSSVAETDGLYTVLAELNEGRKIENEAPVYGLKELSEQAETMGYDAVSSELKLTMNALNVSIFNAFEQSHINTGTGERAITRLAEIFGCKAPKFKRPTLTSLGEEEPDSTDNNQANSSTTDSENVYGSTEKILDFTTGEYVQYGDLFVGYQQEATDKMDAMENEEDRENLKKYYDILAGVSNEDEPNE